MASNLKINVAQYSAKGAKSVNEDFYGMLIPNEPLLSTKGAVIAIADGMSGSDAGGEASEYSVKGFLTDYFSTPESWSVKTSGEKVLSALNSWLYSKGQLNYGSTRGMVTTLSVLVIKSTTAHLFHVGDSRVYRLRDNKFELLTRDHRVWLSPKKNYLNRAMGIDLSLEIDFQSLPVKKGDIFVLTTDGVHDYIRDEEIFQFVLKNENNLERAAEKIVSTALDKNSPDNLTCQIVRVDSLPSQEADEVYRQLTNLPFPPELTEGMVIDGYRVLREIYASNRSQLYLALDADTNRQVVIKTPSVNYEDDPAYIERFLLEEWIGKRINSPYILKVLEQKRERKFLYFVTEHAEGDTLREWIDKHPKPDINEVLEIVKKIAAGLRAFHNMEMLHQDLKPENIIIDESGAIKIIDFGSAKIAGISEISTPVERENLLGTLYYTAPEYLLGQSGSSSSDMFSLGVIAYEMLTGKLPYSERLSQISSERNILKLKYISGLHHNPMLPLWIDGALKKAVQPDPRKRYEALSEFIYDITHPNQQFMEIKPLPLIEKDPVAFWRWLAIFLFLSNLLLLYIFLND